MTKEFHCSDIGFDCGYVAEGKDEQELMPKIAKHAHDAHNMNDVPPETMERIKGAIREE